MQASTNLINFIKSHEGYVPTWYQDVALNWTIGYGYMNNAKLLPDGFTEPLSEEEATALMVYIMPRYEAAVDYAFPSKTFLQWQFDALVDFAYNLGSISSGLKNAINAGTTGTALKLVFEQYTHDSAGVFQPFLKVIRDAEWQMYMYNIYDLVLHDNPTPPTNAAKNKGNNFAVLAAIYMKGGR